MFGGSPFCFDTRVTERRSWAGLAAGVLVLALASCADDGTETAPTAPTSTSTTTSTSSSTTSTTTSEPAADTTTSTTTSTSTTPTTTATTTTATPVPAAEFPYWSTTCTERFGDEGVTYESSEALGTFTTLGAAPTLDIEIPQVVTSAGPYGSIAASVPVPGGVIVGIYPPDGWPSGDVPLVSSSLVAVDDDGSLRWRRCFDDFETRSFLVAPAQADPTTAWVIGSAWNQPLEVRGVDVVTGIDVGFPTRVSNLAQRGGDRRHLVLGRDHGTGQFGDGDLLTLVDTLDGTSREIPVPPSWIGTDGGWVQVLDAASPGDVRLAADFPTPGDATEVFVDGAWVDDPDVQREVLPPQVTESFGAPFELRLLDGAGELIWSVSDFHSVSREGFHWYVGDSVLVASRCTSADADGYCGWVDDTPPTEELVAFDLGTGRELWGDGALAAVSLGAGDLGLVIDTGLAPDGVTVLVDLRTGERIGPEGDPWPSGAFSTGCCGEYDYRHAERDGAVVIATDDRHVRVWYPPELTTPTVSVDLTD